MSKNNDLEILLPENVIPLASSEKVEINPFPFVKLPKVVSLINSIGVGVFVLLEAKKGLTVSETNQETGTAGLDIEDVVINKVNEFITDHFDEVVEILAIYCRRPKEFFLDEEKGPNVEEACQIILSIVERHLGFFTKNLRPILARIRAKAQPGAAS